MYFETLSALYPDPGPGFLSNEERQRYQQRVSEFENAPVNDEPASIERVGQVVMSRQNLVKAGFDHLKLHNFTTSQLHNFTTSQLHNLDQKNYCHD